MEAAKLGLKVEADEVEKFMSASMQERIDFCFFLFILFVALSWFDSGAGKG